MKKKKPSLRQKQIYETLINSPVFWSEIRKSKDKVEIEKNKFNKEKVLTSESKRIVKKLYLPSEWIKNIKKCLMTGKLTLPTTSNCQVILDINYKTKDASLFLKIFRKTTLEDIRRSWKMLKKLQKMLPEIKAQEIDSQKLELLNLRKLGKDYRSIVQKDGKIGSYSQTSARKAYSRLTKLLGVTQKSKKK